MRDKDFKADIASKTAAAWTAENPYLPQNDLGVESDTGKLKVGVGQRWADTPYLPAAKAPSAPTIVDAPEADGAILFYPPSDDGGSPVLGYRFYYRNMAEGETSADVPSDAATLVTESTNGTLDPRPSASKSYLKWTNANLPASFVSVAAYNAIGEGPKGRPVYMYYM